MKLNIAIITNMYPAENSLKGVFIKEQVDALKASSQVVRVDVFDIDQVKSKLPGIFRYFKSSLGLYRFLNSKRYDIIHVHYGLSLIPVVLLLWSSRVRRAKIIVTLHGSDLMGGALVRFLVNILLSCCDKIIIVSSAMAKLVWPRRVHKVLVLPCGVNQQIFKSGRERVNNKDASRTTLKIVFPSNPARPEKDYVFFNQVLFYLSELGVECREVILDGLSRSQVKDVLLNSDLLLLTSKREGSPQVVKEALFCGLPVVSRPVGDVPQIIGGIENCYLGIDPKKIAHWIANSFVRTRLKPSRISTMLNQYSNDEIALRLISVYETLSGRGVHE